VLAGGDTQTFDLKVFRTEELTEYRQAFSSAVPWGVLGAGVAALGAGVGLHLAARSGFQQFDTGVTDCASMTGGACLPSPDLQSARTSANGLQTGAFVLYGVGGAALATSAILFYVGRPIAYRKSVNVEAKVTVVPMITPTSAGAFAAIEF